MEMTSAGRCCHGSATCEPCWRQNAKGSPLANAMKMLGMVVGKVGQPLEIGEKLWHFKICFPATGPCKGQYQELTSLPVESVEGVEEGCAILKGERKALRDNSLWDPFAAQAESQLLWLCNLSYWFPSPLPENAEPWIGALNVAPKPTHWVIALHHALSQMALWTAWVGWRWSQAAGAALCPESIPQALPQDILITPLRSRQGLFRIMQSPSHKGWKRPPK